MPRLPALAAVVLVVLSLPCFAGPGPAIVGIRAFPGVLVIRISGSVPAGRIVELRPYESYSPDLAPSIVSEDHYESGEMTVPRYDDGRDRLYSKFQLVDRKTKRALGPPHWVDDLSALPTWHQPIPWPKSKKGVTCPVDIEDLKTLGVKYTDFGIVLAGIFDWSGNPPAETWEVDGEKLPINVYYIRDLDRQIKRMTELGINITLIPVNGVPAQPDPKKPAHQPLDRSRTHSEPYRSVQPDGRTRPTLLSRGV